MKKVTIFTDGSCLGNPGAGGLAAILEIDGEFREISEGYYYTTNNRMELLAAIRALDSLEELSDVSLYSDSSYLVNGMMLGWAKRWKSQGWVKDKKKKLPALNSDLWETLLYLSNTHRVIYLQVKGHNGVPQNERCDILAKNAAMSPTLTDHAYELKMQGAG
jgi:ribonuclease HI